MSRRLPILCLMAASLNNNATTNIFALAADAPTGTAAAADVDSLEVDSTRVERTLEQVGAAVDEYRRAKDIDWRAERSGPAYDALVELMADEVRFSSDGGRAPRSFKKSNGNMFMLTEAFLSSPRPSITDLETDAVTGKITSITISYGMGETVTLEQVEAAVDEYRRAKDIDWRAERSGPAFDALVELMAGEVRFSSDGGRAPRSFKKSNGNMFMLTEAFLSSPRPSITDLETHAVTGKITSITISYGMQMVSAAADVDSLEADLAEPDSPATSFRGARNRVAAKIQAVYRGNKARAEVDQIRSEKEELDKQRAAAEAKARIPIRLEERMSGSPQSFLIKDSLQSYHTVKSLKEYIFRKTGLRLNHLECENTVLTDDRTLEDYIALFNEKRWQTIHRLEYKTTQEEDEESFYRYSRSKPYVSKAEKVRMSKDYLVISATKGEPKVKISSDPEENGVDVWLFLDWGKLKRYLSQTAVKKWSLFES